MKEQQKYRWIVIRTLYTSWYDGKSFVEQLNKKFPNVKFKIGKIRLASPAGEFPVLLVPIMAYLPTPHPNEQSRKVYEYANSLIRILFWGQDKQEEDQQEQQEQHVTMQIEGQTFAFLSKGSL